MRLCKDKEGLYAKVTEALLGQKKRQEALKQAEASRSQENVARPKAETEPWKGLSPPPTPTVSSLPSPPVSTISSSPDKSSSKKRKAFALDSDASARRSNSVSRAVSHSSLSASTSRRQSSRADRTLLAPQSHFSHRTFPIKVAKSAAFERFYRRFPVSSYYQLPGTP